MERRQTAISRRGWERERESGRVQHAYVNRPATLEERRQSAAATEAQRQQRLAARRGANRQRAVTRRHLRREHSFFKNTKKRHGNLNSLLEDCETFYLGHCATVPVLQDGTHFLLFIPNRGEIKTKKNREHSFYKNKNKTGQGA